MTLREASSSGRVAMFATVLNVAGMSIHALMYYRSIGRVPWPELQSILVSALLFAVLYLRRGRSSALLGSAAFLLNNASILVALWMTETPPIVLGRMWAPFQAEKLGTLAVALLAPPGLWAGPLSILGFTASPIAHAAWFDAAARARLPISEPWASLAYGLFGLLLLFYRLRAKAIEREMARVSAEVAAREQLTRALLAVRDLTNTPTQTLCLAAALLRERHPQDEALLDRMDRALNRLREINGVVGAYESKVAWQSGDESFDAMTVLSGDFRPLSTAK